MDRKKVRVQSTFHVFAAYRAVSLHSRTPAPNSTLRKYRVAVKYGSLDFVTSFSKEVRYCNSVLTTCFAQALAINKGRWCSKVSASASVQTLSRPSSKTSVGRERLTSILLYSLSNAALREFKLYWLVADILASTKLQTK
ncbi:hypothetical protein Y032_0014g2435 [Ancylostoma ceylanicum]|uniref:Uncharacterized protein n=1 Tax=Ancylostoma ceylanicum TaxID=53326 RepID=A0A016VAK8_9BILA|nr:hypothetical protein Y032_0014g2435 [Ancylostoma ceylanicum]